MVGVDEILNVITFSQDGSFHWIFFIKFFIEYAGHDRFELLGVDVALLDKAMDQACKRGDLIVKIECVASNGVYSLIYDVAYISIILGDIGCVNGVLWHGDPLRFLK